MVFHITIFFFISNHKHNQSYLLSSAGQHNLRSFLAANLTQKNFLIAFYIGYDSFLIFINPKIPVKKLTMKEYELVTT